MNPGEIDQFPVGQLQSRYDLARSAVYKRMDQLGIVPKRVGKHSHINGQQLRLMDELHIFINQGGSAAEFVEARGLQPRPVSTNGQSGGGSTLTTTPGDFGGLISAIVSEVVSRVGLGSGPDPLKYFETLENAARNGWLPSTSELAELIDLSPREIESYGDRFSEAGFVFSRAGYRKNGEIAWKVAKRLK